MRTIPLLGCTPTPLAAYLKALGILRVLSQQRPEAQAKGFWRGNTFILISSHDEAALVDFFLTRYSPAPLVAPWNGGSGFHPKDNTEALDAILASTLPAFENYRDTIRTAREALIALGLTEKPEKEIKESLLLRCRNTFSETAIEWLDSAFVLIDDGAKYPPLLGTGGNDGRLEFTNNFMQRLTEVFDLAENTPAPSSPALLRHALFDHPIKGLVDKPIGQFSPAASGGANASTGFDAKSAINPWDFILALEGALLFAAAVVKRLERVSPGQLVYPFCVQPSGAGYGSATQADESAARCEIWMPLWSAPSGLQEIQSLFSEGRAWVGARPAKDGLDFARAVASLGVDRGIAEFQRYGFHVRNGLAYFATPLQRLRVHRDVVTADLLSTCDLWVQRFLQKAKGDTTPGSVRRAAAQLEAAIFAHTAAAQSNNLDTAQELLIALGACECALATSSAKWREESFLKPIPPLPLGWIPACDNGKSIEYRLATSLASLRVHFKNEFFPIRRHLEAVKVITGEKQWADWDDEPRNDVVWHEGSIIDVLCALMKRRLLLAKSASCESWPEYARVTAWPSDIAAFIEGRIDEARFAELLWGLSLVDFSGESMQGHLPIASVGTRDEIPSAFYAQLKLCFAGRLPEGKQIPIEPIIFNLAMRGDGTRASTQALRRLHGSSVPVTPIHIPLEGDTARRTAAALLFPLWYADSGYSQLTAVGNAVAPNFFASTITH